jgi:hypothetical protein
MQERKDVLSFHLKIPTARRETGSKFKTDDRQITYLASPSNIQSRWRSGRLDLCTSVVTYVHATELRSPVQTKWGYTRDKQSQIHGDTYQHTGQHAYQHTFQTNILPNKLTNVLLKHTNILPKPTYLPTYQHTSQRTYQTNMLPNIPTFLCVLLHVLSPVHYNNSTSS